MNFTDEYRTERTDGRNCSFVGMNTGNGFCGRYRDIIDERRLKRLYIIKGAPGTGKSTLMKTCGEYARSEGWEVEYYMCSSDASSVDAVVIGGSVALVDGTSPHALEMKYPGGVSRIFDTTAFWDSAALEERREEIISLTDAKKRCFSSAYSYLSALSKLRGELAELASEIVTEEKLAAFADRFVRSLPKSRSILPNGGRGRSEDKPVHSIGMRGRLRLDTYETAAERTVRVNDEYFTSYALTDALAERLRNAGYLLSISRDPVCPRFIRSIFVNDCATLITIDSADRADEAEGINMSRFVDRDALAGVRGELRLTRKCAAALADGALEMLALAGQEHFKLEKIYSSAVDFTALDGALRRLCTDISRCTTS